MGVSRVFQGCFEDVPKVFQGQVYSRFQGSNKVDPRGFFMCSKDERLV